MNTLYLDIFSGISGDMFLGAMIDLGVDATELEAELAKLNLDGYQLHVSRKTKANIDGVKFDVLRQPGTRWGRMRRRCSFTRAWPRHEHPVRMNTRILIHSHDGDGHSHERNFADIKKIIHDSPLSDWVKEKSVAVFRRVAEAEGQGARHVAGRSALSRGWCRWTLSSTLSAPALRWNASANPACWPPRWLKAPVGSTAPMVGSRCLRQRHSRFSVHAA